jgi:hypothetical protein
LVNADRVKRKIISLIVGECSSRHKKDWNKYMRYRYCFEQFIKRNPERANTLMNKVIADLAELELAVENTKA